MGDIIKILICTFGKDPKRIFSALRVHKYDQLILILEYGVQDTSEFKKVLELEKINPSQPDIITVNPNNFMECYKSIEKTIIHHPHDEIILNISGGTKLLSIASILSAFNLGIHAYHYESERLVKVPVFKGVTIKERLTSEQIEILLQIE